MSDKIVVHVDIDLEDIAPIFLNNKKKDIGKIYDALEQGDFNTIQVLGHRMKGAGGGYGFDEITRIGGLMETAAKQQLTDQIRSLTAELDSYLERVEPVYEEMPE